MEKQLIIKRTHVSFGEEQFQFLSAHSDHPLADGFIFSRVFCDADSFQSFLALLKEQLALTEEFCSFAEQTFPAEFFRDQSLVLMFSDERSGANRLTLHACQCEADTVHLTIDRERGLTMDMAYLFLFLPLDRHDIRHSAVQIQDAGFPF